MIPDWLMIGGTIIAVLGILVGVIWGIVSFFLMLKNYRGDKRFK